MKTANHRLEYEVWSQIGHKHECSGYEFTSPKSLAFEREPCPATPPPREIPVNFSTKNKLKSFNDDYVIDL